MQSYTFLYEKVRLITLFQRKNVIKRTFTKESKFYTDY